MGVIQPYCGWELVFGHHDGLRELAVAHVDANLSTSWRQEDFGKCPHPSAPLLEHQFWGVDFRRVVRWASYGNGQGVCASNHIADAIDLVTNNQLDFSSTWTACFAYILLELVVWHTGASNPVCDDSSSTCSSVGHLMQDPEVLWCVELLRSVSNKHVGKCLA